MITAITISAVTCILMVLVVLLYPQIKIGKVSLGTYWVVTLVGAAVLLLSGCVEVPSLGAALVADSAINPIKILVLFISMTILSIFLDELGFFRYLANVALKRAGTSQLKLFMLLYVTVSILTVFTSNDIIILSFTPFICYFAKNAKISPLPFLAAEFVAAAGKKNLAAIASSDAAERYGLQVLERNINSSRSNTTRFAVLSRTENDHVMDGGENFILMFTVKNEAGALAKAIDVIGRYGFNMRCLRSRPMKELLWQYYFYVEAEGCVHSAAGEAMMRDLGIFCDRLKMAGTYTKN